MRRLFYFLIVVSCITCKNDESLLDSIKDSKPENPLEREMWRWERKGKEATPEKAMYAKAVWDRKFKTQQNKKNSRDGGLNDWEEKGPFGIGGRIRSIAVDPNDNNHIFIGSVGGGLWVTNDGGTNWNPVNDFMEGLAISSVIYDATNPNIIYVGTGEFFACRPSGCGGGLPGYGIFISYDGGQSFNHSELPTNISGSSLNNSWITEIVSDPLNPGSVYVLANQSNPDGSSSGIKGVIHKSNDNGNTWTTPIGSRDGSSFLNIDYLCDIKINPTNNNIIITTWDGNRNNSSSTGLARILRSTDQGFTFNTEQILNAERGEIAISEQNTSNLFITFSNQGFDRIDIWNSVDSGDSWSILNSNIDFGGQATYNNCFWIDPNNEQQMISGGIDLYRSLDGGISWNPISDWVDDINGNSGGSNNSIHADQHAIIPYNNYNGTSNNGVYIGNDGGLYSTNNIWSVTANSGWQSNVGDLAITQFYGGSISSDGQTIIGGAQDNSFSFSTDGGTSWSQPTTGDGAYAAINYNDDQIIYANTNYNRIFKSTDGGVSFDFIAAFTTLCAESGCGGNPQCVNGGVSSCCWPIGSSCCTTLGQYPTTGCVDGDRFLVSDNPSLISLFIMDPNDPDIILVGAQRIWRNIDAGNANAWSVIKGDRGGTTLISAIAVDDGSSARIWTGYNDGVLERSTNTGFTWTGNINPQTSSGLTLPSSPFVTDIAINPNNSNEVIVSYGGYNTNNLFYTSNGNSTSPTWTNINTGIPIQINTVEWHPSNSNWIYVGTDFGILASEDKGQNWSITPLYSGTAGHEGPVNTEVSELFWQPNTTRLCAATHGRGIWRSNSIKDKIYVDKNHSCGPFGIFCLGTFDFPYDNFKDALSAAGHGSEIIFLSDGIHEEVNNTPLVLKKRVKLTIDNGGNSVIIE